MNKTKINFVPLISSIVAILLGLFIGLIILFICNPGEALPGFATILTGAISNGPKDVGQVLYYAMPLILCGLSVGFAFKTGLFNIGGSGQFMIGSLGAIWVALVFDFGPFTWVVALLVAMLFGAIAGAIPGILKAFFNVNEVITCIMLNYICLYIVNMTVRGNELLFNPNRNESLDIMNKGAILPKAGLDTLFKGSAANIGFIIAVVAAIVVFILLEKTTFGYELKACGYNKQAAKYAGVNENRSIIMSMVIAGALSGLAGGIMLISGTGRHIEIKDVVVSEGFNGISVALLGASNPIAIIFSGLFIAYLTAGGFYLQMFNFSKEIIDIIIAIIIYFSAFSLMVKIVLDKMKLKKSKKE